jgi:hypothetical protein
MATGGRTLRTEPSGDKLHAIDRTSPRFLRAKRFSDLIVHLLSDFLPRDRECRYRILDYLLETAYGQNAEIISVPPEWDALTKLEIERRMLETRFGPKIKLEGPCPKCGNADWLIGPPMCDNKACPVTF